MTLPEGESDARPSERDRARSKTRLVTAIARAGTLGCALRGGLSCGKLLARGARRGAGGVDGARVARAMRETVAYGGFLAAFAGTYVAVDETLRERFGGEASKRWRCAVAGACAGPSLLLTGADVRHYGLAGYIWVRSLVLMTRVAQKSENPAVKKLTQPTKMEHGDVVLMVGSAMVILSCFILKPETVEPAYRHFLEMQCGKSVEELSALKQLCEAGRDEDVRAWCLKIAESGALTTGNAARDLANKTAVRAMADGVVPIDRSELYRLLYFGGASNLEHLVSHVAKIFPTTLSLYVPVYLIPALLIHRGNLLSPKKAPDLLSRIAMGSARSALFLSSYVSAAWSGVDLANRAFGKGTCDGRSLMLGCSFAGWATFIEKKSRRMELAMYCASRAAETAALVAVYRGLIPKSIQRQRGDILLFSIASATIMHCYNTERDVFRSKYLNILDYVFGSAGHDSQSISHAASYEILFDATKAGKSAQKYVLEKNTPANAALSERELLPINTYVSEEQFYAASLTMKDTLNDASVEEILKLYGLYKQATCGDAMNHKRPGMLDQRGRAKYSAWERFEGLSPQAAMTGYCMLVDELTAGFETAPPSPAGSTNADDTF